MADSPIGISFIPTAANQAQGPTAARTQGDLASGGDLAQAFKILSLRLPTVVGASAPVAPTLLNSAGSAGLASLPGGMNPYAAVFQALLKAHTGGFDLSSLTGSLGGGSMSGGPDLSGLTGGMAGVGGDAPSEVPRPKITLGGGTTDARPSTGMSDAAPATGAGGYDTPSTLGGDNAY